jgi:hypothetical protein
VFGKQFLAEHAIDGRWTLKAIPDGKTKRLKTTPALTVGLIPK